MAREKAVNKWTTALLFWEKNTTRKVLRAWRDQVEHRHKNEVRWEILQLYQFKRNSENSFHSKDPFKSDFLKELAVRFYEFLLYRKCFVALRSAKLYREEKELKLLKALQFWQTNTLKAHLDRWILYTKTFRIAPTKTPQMTRILIRWIDISLNISLHTLSPVIHRIPGM